MNNIEEDLKRALRRQNPPADWVGKIMNRVGSGGSLESEPTPGRGRILGFPPKPKVMLWVATAAAACLVGVFITRSYMADRGKTLVPGRKQTSALGGQPGAVQQQPGGDQVTSAGGRQDESNPEPNLAGGRREEHMYHVRRASYHRRAPSYPSEEARQAEEQLKLALAITSAKLGYAQRSIQEADGTGTTEREVNR